MAPLNNFDIRTYVALKHHLKVPPHKIAYTALLNWEIRLQDPEFRWRLKGPYIESIIKGLDNWRFTQGMELEKLDECILRMERIYKECKKRNIPNIEWLLPVRQRFISKCIKHFNERLLELGEVTVRNKDCIKGRVAQMHRDKYKDRINTYTLWLNP